MTTVLLRSRQLSDYVSVLSDLFFAVVLLCMLLSTILHRTLRYYHFAQPGCRAHVKLSSICFSAVLSRRQFMFSTYQDLR
jgi:hypothetical protein